MVWQNLRRDQKRITRGTKNGLRFSHDRFRRERTDNWLQQSQIVLVKGKDNKEKPKNRQERLMTKDIKELALKENKAKDRIG